MVEGDGARDRPRAAAADGATHAGVAVLGTRALFIVITDFMTGYLYVVLKFYSDFREKFLLHDTSTNNNTPQHTTTTAENNGLVMQGVDRTPPRFKRDTVLLHLAIAANDAEML